MFAYCNDNPIMFSDPDGHSIILACILVGAAVGALAGGHIAAKVSKAKTGQVKAGAVAKGMIVGGAVGGLAGWGVGSAVTAIGAAATGTGAATVAPVVEEAVEQYESWRAAEDALRNTIDSVLPRVDRLFSTPYGNRVVDAFNSTTNVIAEAKYGYQGLSSFIASEIQRDAWLLENGVVTAVEWHFYYSQISDTIGPSCPLYDALIEAGITVIFH